MGIGTGSLFSADAGFVNQIIQIVAAANLTRKFLKALGKTPVILSQDAIAGSHALLISFIHAIFL
jgi:hypothetical protein